MGSCPLGPRYLFCHCHFACTRYVLDNSQRAVSRMSLHLTDFGISLVSKNRHKTPLIFAITLVFLWVPVGLSGTELWRSQEELCHLTLTSFRSCNENLTLCAAEESAGWGKDERHLHNNVECETDFIRVVERRKAFASSRKRQHRRQSRVLDSEHRKPRAQRRRELHVCREQPCRNRVLHGLPRSERYELLFTF